MGLFGSLFGRSRQGGSETQVKKRKEEPETPETPEAPYLKALYRGMLLTVAGDEETDLFFLGKLASFSAAGLSLEPSEPRGSLPQVPRGTVISLRGYQKNVSSIHLSAVVKDSEREVLRVGEVELIEHPESRSDFRLPLHVEAELFAFSDTGMRSPTPCTVVNISQGGACISTQKLYRKGDALRLRVCLMEGTPVHSFAGTVIRVIQRGEAYEYGIQFEQLSEQRVFTLVNSMFAVQRKMRSELVERGSY